MLLLSTIRINPIACVVRFVNNNGQIVCHRFLSSARVASDSKQNHDHQQQTEYKKPHTSSTTRSHTVVKAYRNLYPWRSEFDLAKSLAANLVYATPKGLLAFNKPWGLPIHASNNNFNTSGGGKHKEHYLQQILTSEIMGDSKFNMMQVIDLVKQCLNLNPKLTLTHACHRNWSGLTLFSTNERVNDAVKKSIKRARASLIPFMRFYCITSGIITQPEGEERCGIKLYELDELGDYKEPCYVPPDKMSNNRRKYSTHGKYHYVDGPIKPVNVKYRTLATNRQLAVSLVQLDTSVTKWSFVQCFLAYKASFVLGDTVCSHRVKHLLGQPIVSQTRKVLTREQICNAEQESRLSPTLSKQLGVQRNAQIPLMIHFGGITLPGFNRSIKSIKSDPEIRQYPPLPPLPAAAASADPKEVANLDQQSSSNDLIINCDQLPEHFVRTLDALELNIFK